MPLTLAQTGAVGAAPLRSQGWTEPALVDTLPLGGCFWGCTGEPQALSHCSSCLSQAQTCCSFGDVTSLH